MAKKKAPHPLHMPVPAKIGFSVLAIVVMVYAIFLASMYSTSNQTQTQTIQTHAYFVTPTKCQWYFHGSCKSIRSCYKTGGYSIGAKDCRSGNICCK